VLVARDTATCRSTRNGSTSKEKRHAIINGPAKLCQALGIDKSLNGWDLTRSKELWVEDYKKIPAKSIITTPRIGIDYAEKNTKMLHGDSYTYSESKRFFKNDRAVFGNNIIPKVIFALSSLI